jgi:hypothetical protein
LPRLIRQERHFTEHRIALQARHRQLAVADWPPFAHIQHALHHLIQAITGISFANNRFTGPEAQAAGQGGKGGQLLCAQVGKQWVGREQLCPALGTFQRQLFR